MDFVEEALRFLTARMQIEAEWAVQEQTAFTWWAHTLAQRVWVTPPLWKPDTGFIKVIHENAAPCRTIDSTALVGDLPRKRDKIHPNDEGREIWADAVMSWLGREREGTPERPWALRPPGEASPK